MTPRLPAHRLAAQFFPPLYAGEGAGEKGDKAAFTAQFDKLKAAVLGKAKTSEADIKALSLADKFLARRLRLQALKYRDHLVEVGKFDEFKKLTADQAWSNTTEVVKATDPKFLDNFTAGKVGTDSPAFSALPDWGKEALSQMKADEGFIASFKAKNPESAKNIEAAISAVCASGVPAPECRKSGRGREGGFRVSDRSKVVWLE
jgi:hypothetical protein